jgi:aryl-alcohol dehydrogenase-like predicted oxidoreductase
MRLRLLGNSGLRVSALCLGTMTFGEDWGWGASPAVCRQIFDAFAAAGGNFIDTSNNYTNGTSEKIVGECIQAERERYVVATKYSLRVQTGLESDVNLGGNSRRSLVRSVEKSLKRLNTDYLDLLYLHMWDYTTPVEEVLQTVQHLMVQGKLLYFAFSDTPAWVVASALAKAEAHGWPKPVGIQVPWSLLDRGVEREVLPMARANDLAVLPWGLLESGTLTGKYSAPNADEPRRQASASETEMAAGAAVVRLAGEIGRSPAQVAINWVRQQPGNIIPILGARTLKQLEDNLGCLDFRLTDEHLASLAGVARFNQGFPNGFLHSDHVRGLIFGKTFGLLDQTRAG